jgi:DNA repair protein RecN (Recombination protein N)
LISRFYLKDYISFDEVVLEFDKGLIIFSGPSGAGKSILMQSIVSLFGQGDSKAKVSEIMLEETTVTNDAFIIEDNEFTIKQNTSAKTSYFLENQSISKKALADFSKQFFKHLHLKDTSDFESDKIIEFLDFIGCEKFENYCDTLKEFQDTFLELKEIKTKLAKVYEDEKNIEELKEFTQFEIEKIASINPQIDEYDELKSLKEVINQKDKLEEVLNEAKPLLDNSYKVSKALEILDVDSSFFDDAVNEVNNQFEKFYDKLLNIDDVNIEDTLDRIEELSKLIKKYGSIEEALEYKKEKEKELEGYEDISFNKAILEKNHKKLSDQIQTIAKDLSSFRNKSLKILAADMEKFLNDLYLKNLSIELEEKELSQNGCDKVLFSLNGIELKKLSSGEFNRLRLALLTARSVYECEDGGVLFLDEIDANLSGKESESIAKVLKVLANNYQIFAISHQPQLSSSANQHFLVEKNDGVSLVRELNKEERVSEISRMISGENITEEAIEFAKKLLK